MKVNEPVSERNYLDIQELGTVRALMKIHSSIVVANSESITVDEFQTIGESLYQWHEKLTKKINCKIVEE